MTDEGRTRLIMLPGLGADHRLVMPQRRLPVSLEVPAWIKPRPGESLAEYGRRMAEIIDISSEFWLAGISFGGMVALEMARHLRPRGVILISSGRSCEAIPSIRRLAGKLTPWIPSGVLRRLHSMPGQARALFGAATPEQAALFAAMLKDTPPEFLRWSICALLRWRPEPTEVSIFHIHGERDRVIPLRRVRPDAIIAGAGHLVSLTHADEINRLILEVIENR
jgi:pimeloyl-ACP methyl ester carboxylesterase